MSKCRYCSHMDLRDQDRDGYCYCDYYGKYFDPDSSGCGHNDNEGNGVEPTEGCYLTTAMCNILGKPDNCYELEMLRGFRENYMRKTDEGRVLLNQYDVISIPIAASLLKNKDRVAIANNMRDQYINVAIDLIIQGENELAIEQYKRMVFYIKDILGVE